jgi:hypothetical protein
MNVKQLKKELEKYSDEMDVFLSERKTEFSYGLLNSVKKRKIDFKESPDDDEALASGDVVVLDEE